MALIIAAVILGVTVIFAVVATFANMMSDNPNAREPVLPGTVIGLLATGLFAAIHWWG